MRLLLCLICALSWVACNAPRPLLPAESQHVPTLLAQIDSTTVVQHLKVLSADEMEGRGTGTAGEKKAVEYIASEMKKLGLMPAGENGTYFQNVPLLGSTPSVVSPLTFTDAKGASFSAEFVTGFTASTDLDREAISTEGELVFVGYGISAPNLGWDDFKGMDVKGKILVSFVNDPPPTETEPRRFKGDTLTYFGRWTYKHEEARRRGAKGIVLIHTTPTASYPFAVVGNSAPREQIQFAKAPENPLEIKSWLSEQNANRLAEMAGSSLEAWFVAAASKDFKPQVLPIKAKIGMNYKVRRFSGTNVIGKLEGTEKPDEAIVFTAHHDHLGIGKADKNGDTIYNGAVDNASGVAMMLTMAKAFTHIPKPKRSLLFVSVTAEESGLLGATYYADHPSIPMAKTVANLNTDSGNVYGRTRDISGIGAETSDLLQLYREAASSETMRVSPDPNPNAGLFFRSDQLAFARMGVPAIFINNGSDYIGRAKDFYSLKEAEYRALRYHQPDDEFDAAWAMGGMIQQMRVCARLGNRLANTSLWPQWKAGAEFETVRKTSQKNKN